MRQIRAHARGFAAQRHERAIPAERHQWRMGAVGCMAAPTPERRGATGTRGSMDFDLRNTAQCECY